MVPPRVLFWDPFSSSFTSTTISDIDLGLNNFISKFAEDTKIGNAGLSECNRRSLQKDLSKISEWSIKWEMSFIMKKVPDFVGFSSNIKDYVMWSVKIKKT